LRRQAAQHQNHRVLRSGAGVALLRRDRAGRRTEWFGPLWRIDDNAKKADR
jgi:hypothetical protein